MILRVWRCTAMPEGADRYIEYFNRTVRPHVESIAGFLDARVLRRIQGGAVEILVMTEWDNEHAVRAFAGNDIDAAVVEPEALAFLIHADTRVRNFVVVT